MQRPVLHGVLAWLIISQTPLAAQQPPSYARDVKPFLARYCVECHNPDKVRGGLNLETFKGIQAGGENGPVLVAGKPDDSRIVLQAEHKTMPFMPPKKARQPGPEEVALLRRWVAAGAKDDSAVMKVAVPDIKPKAPVAEPITALAYAPDGKRLAAGGHREVVLLDTASGDVAGKTSGLPGQVTAAAYSHDGRHLAVAVSSPGAAGAVRICAVTAAGVSAAPEHSLAGHADVIYDLAWSPNDKTVATCGYDRLIKLWDAATGKERLTLKDHSDTVYSLSFSPDGKLLASGAADRAVKVWNVATGVRLYTLGEPTDWVYAVAWSPDGRHLAAAGVDKSIRVWEVTPSGGRVVQSVFAHEGPVTRLRYSADGRTLYSLGEDRTIKAWETERMVERTVYPRQPEAVLSLAVRLDHKQLAAGRYDGTLALLDEATGKVQSEPLPVKPKPPKLSRLTPASGTRGQKVTVTFEGQYLDPPLELVANRPGVSATFLADGRTATRVRAEITFPADTPAGVYPLGLKSAGGQTPTLPFTLDLFAPAAEQEPNDAPGTGQAVTLPVSVVGAVDKAGDVDWYRFDVAAGQQVGVQILTGAVGSKLEPVLALTDAAGNVIRETDSGVLGHTFARAGRYALGVRDREYRGGGDMAYRLHVGEVPVVTSVFPLGVRQGAEAEVRLEGVHLGPATTARVKAPAGAGPGSTLPVPVVTPAGTALGDPKVVVGEFAEVIAPPNAGAPLTVPVPGTANGRIGQPGATETWRFAAKKGQPLVLEVNARRLGSRLDSSIEVLDLAGRPVPRAVLRCLSKTYTTFRDHDSSGPGMRIEAWTELAMKDYLYVGSELVRIRELPKNPDDDCQFFSRAGQRRGFLDTTPTYHAFNTPMYKVSIHPPGTTFPPNGFPVFTIDYRNDDGGPGYGKDSRLFFDPPADGDYLVRVGDATGQAGSDHGYRLTVRPPRPGFTVSFNPTAPAVWKGGAVPVTVSADRTDGFEGAIDVRLENLPPGFSAPATTIPAGEESTVLALWADASARTPAGGATLKLVARAVIEGKEVTREVTGAVPKAADPGDLVTATDQSDVRVRPGGQVTVTAHVERRNGFAGRVPLEVKGLPYGVRVLDIGLNGILITEKESARTFVIYAEPWVRPTAHPFVVLAKREGTNAEYAARSVLLKVAEK